MMVGAQFEGAKGAGGDLAETGASPAAWESLVAHVVASNGFELVKAELKGAGRGRLLRVFVDQPSGVGLDECERVSRALSAALDQDEAALPGSYTLEVSSPGIERPLTKWTDFERFAGQRIEVRTREPIEGRRRFRGEVTGVEPGALLPSERSIRLRIEAETGSGPAGVVLAWENITEAHLAPRLPFAERAAKPAGGSRGRRKAGKKKK